MKITETIVQEQSHTIWGYDHFGKHSSFFSSKSDPNGDYDFRIEWSEHIQEEKRIKIAEALCKSLAGI